MRMVQLLLSVKRLQYIAASKFGYIESHLDKKLDLENHLPGQEICQMRFTDSKTVVFFDKMKLQPQVAEMQMQVGGMLIFFILK